MIIFAIKTCILEAAQIGTKLSCTRNVLELCNTLSKLNCVSFIRKELEIIVFLPSTTIVDCRYSLKSLNRPSFLTVSNEKIRLLILFKQFSKLIFDSSFLMIISMIMNLMNSNVCTTVKT